MSEDPRLAAFMSVIDKAFDRRRDGPICALCQFSPLDEVDLERDHPMDPHKYPETVRTFRCEATGRNHMADGGRGCGKFARR